MIPHVYGEPVTAETGRWRLNETLSYLTHLERTGRAQRIEKVRFVISRTEITAFDAVPQVYGQAITPMNANWWLSETLCYLTHLERSGRAERIPGEPERWRSL